MESAQSREVLTLTTDLERRDAEVAAEIDRVARLGSAAKEIAVRAEAIRALLNRAPAEHAALDRAEVEALAHRSTADADLGAAAAALAKVEAERRDIAAARRGVEHAEVAAQDAVAHVERISCTRATLVTSERAARVDVPILVAEAQAVAGRLAGLPRVSASGRAAPEPSVAGLVEWAARVNAALVVVRGQLDVERDRLVREANELGSVVLGESLAGTSVALVGRRVRTVLAG